jgi:hypothetical protein
MNNMNINIYKDRTINENQDNLVIYFEYIQLTRNVMI